MTSHETLLDPFLKDAFARWKETATTELKGNSFEKKLVSQTPEGIALQPLYTRANLVGLPALNSRPGEVPFLRGFDQETTSGRFWEIAQEIAARHPRDFNAALLADLDRGQDSVVLTADAATRAGLDPDEAIEGVFSGGISLADRGDFDVALHKVELTAVSVHLRAGADARPLAALFLASAQENGFALADLRGSLTADPLSTAAEKGRVPQNLEADFDALACWCRWATLRTPLLKTIGVDGSLWANAGATASQELALCLSASSEYIRNLLERGFSLEAIGQHFQFRFSVGPHFFTEIAKFRAFRPLWTRVVTAFGGVPASGKNAIVSAATGHWNKSLLDPYVNMLRVTTEALSAVLGGCNLLHIAPFDEETGVTNDFSRRIARNVHTLLAEEFGVALTRDPAGGSWYVERLTDDIARAAWLQFQDFEARGGFTACLNSGYTQALVAKAATAKNEAIARRRRALVGTNLFPNLSEIPLAPALAEQNEIDARQREIVVRRLPCRFAKPTNPFDVSSIDFAIAAASKGTTLGQLTELLRPRPRVYFANSPVTGIRASAEFEGLRRATIAFASRRDGRPKVFLAKMGPNAQHKARAEFSAGYFASGGFEVMDKKTFEDPESAALEAISSQASIAVLCSTDESYPTLAVPFAQAIKKSSPKTIVVLAGLPSDAAVAETFRSAGFDEFIHLQSNLPETLNKFLARIEVSL